MFSAKCLQDFSNPAASRQQSLLGPAWIWVAVICGCSHISVLYSSKVFADHILLSIQDLAAQYHQVHLMGRVHVEFM